MFSQRSQEAHPGRSRVELVRVRSRGWIQEGQRLCQASAQPATNSRASARMRRGTDLLVAPSGPEIGLESTSHVQIRYAPKPDRSAPPASLKRCSGRRESRSAGHVARLRQRQRRHAEGQPQVHHELVEAPCRYAAPLPWRAGTVLPARVGHPRGGAPRAGVALLVLLTLPFRISHPPNLFKCAPPFPGSSRRGPS